VNTCLYSIYRRNFGSFVDFAFRELHSGETMRDNWHIRVVADLLQYLWLNPDPETTRKLIFNLPPDSLKTHICSVAFPAWVLGRDPTRSVLIVSETNDEALDIRDRIVELMRSKRYNWLFRRLRIEKLGKDVEFNHGGRIRHAGIASPLPRRKSDVVIIDNPQSLHGLHRMDPANFADIAATLRDPETGIIQLVTRRLGATDFSSYFRSQLQWGCMAVPVVGTEDNEWKGPYNEGHIYRRGEVLRSDRQNWEGIEKRIIEVGGEAFSWQYMQGLYRPQTTGHRMAHDEHGVLGKIVGSFDPSAVTLQDLGNLRAEYLENISV
jgi:hypothetical protein